MSTLSIVKVFIFFNLLAYFTVCNRYPLLAFTGCNATLQWNIGNSSYKEERIYFRITDNARNVIATEENNQCMSQNNLSMSCVLSHKNEDWIIFVTLMNITTNHTGNYTAWLRDEQLLHFVKKTTPLIVIDKPQIMEVRKPVLYQSFTVMCTISYTSDCIIYYWKINGSDLQDSINLHATMSTLTYRNVTMMDNFSKLTCRAGIEKCSNILCNSSEDSDPYTIEPYCRVSDNNCCIESDAYVPGLYYGPHHVTLNLNRTDIYLRVNETFKVICSAKCNPLCTFLWDGYISSKNEELLINSFDSRMAGLYNCVATNLKTGVTVKSEPIVLHYVHDTCVDGSSLGNSGDIRFKEYWIGTVIVSVFLLIVGSLMYVKKWRKRLARELDSSILRDVEINRGPCSMGVTAKRKRQMKLLTTVNMENKTYNEDCNICPQPQDLNNPRQEKAERTLQEDTYRKIDQTALSFYDYATCTVSKGNTHATESSNKDSHYDYVSSRAMCQVEKADLHVTDENYITPINDPDCPIEQCENGVTDVIGSDQTYITPISDIACPIKICHDTYITPISD